MQRTNGLITMQRSNETLFKYLFTSWVKLDHASVFSLRCFHDLFTLLLCKFISRAPSFDATGLGSSDANERQILPGYDLFLGWVRAAGFGECHG